MKDAKDAITILGAGISGLIAAKTAEENGYKTIIFEKDATAGGRVQTDVEDHIYFERGFQVLLTAYPEAQRHLDYDSLDLLYFKPGALIFKSGKIQRIGDPLRDISAFWPTLKTSVGSVKDKIKIFTLSQKLKRKSIEAIFESDELSTLQYLSNYGFSKRIIANFFKPFFTGIFLENDLKTSSRMFEFVFKMFAMGEAAIPSKGIGAISGQLKDNLKLTYFKFNTEIKDVKEASILLADGTSVKTNAAITTFPKDEITWKSCHNFYFEVENKKFDTGIIGLVSETEALINNLHYLFKEHSNGKTVISVTVVKKTALGKKQLIAQVEKELKEFCGIKTLKLLKHYHIKKALPAIEDLKMYGSDSTNSPKNHTSAGDYLLNGSLNAAMLSGEKTVKAILNS